MKLLTIIKRSLSLALVSVLLTSATIALPTAVSAASVDGSKSAACDGIGLTNGSDGCKGGDEGAVTDLVGTVVNLLSVVVGVAAVVMIIVAGLRYITSGGEASKVSGAKSAIIYAIVGIVIVALAQFIIHVVLDSARTGKIS